MDNTRWPTLKSDWLYSLQPNMEKLYTVSKSKIGSWLRLISSVQFSHSVVSDSLRPHEPQNTRPPCPSPTPRVYPNPCPLSQWCHPSILSSVVPFSSCPQSFLATAIQGILKSLLQHHSSKASILQQSAAPSAVILEPRIMKCLTLFPLFPHLFATNGLLIAKFRFNWRKWAKPLDHSGTT